MAELLLFVKFFLVNVLDYNKKIRIIIPMHNGFAIKERPTCVNAGGALFVVPVRGSSSGQGRGGYITETSVRTWLSAPFKWGRAVGSSPAPDHQPRDRTPRKMTALRNIARFGSIFHTAAGLSHMPDRTRHEHPSPRKAN